MNFKILKHPLVLSSILLFLIHQIIEKGFGYSVPILHAYLDDLLCMPIVLGLGMQIIQWIHPIKDLYFLDKNAIIITVVFYSLLFEAILPFVNPSVYTADWIDIIMYSTGAILFYNLVSIKVKEEYLSVLKEL
ncbi:magnesium citrate secondary transporter [Marivirga sp.]|uniref:magnesium citrate secondary transporter n=1 Tax=Marivirga sp. TaxID=2018662 RepID=UPI0025FE6233|nr:magnesium citrate secondary transporter [Marivirga sp.]